MNIHWTTLTARYPDERDCLAGFLACQAAEVVSGGKPANLINILDRQLSCGRNIHDLWRRHATAVLAAGELEAVELQHKPARVLLLIYRPALLSRILEKKVVRKTLAGLGYRYDGYKTALDQLQDRMREGDFPHEIGFFLGYPVKDVLGFMGLVDLPLTGRSPWKMYGRLETSLATLESHRAARQSVFESLASAASPLTLLQAGLSAA